MPSNAAGGQAQAAKMPFIMPDGRPLGAFLQDQTNLGLLKAEHRHKRRTSGARRRAVAAGWTGGGGSKAGGVAPPPPLRALTEAEVLELQALERVGQRRQRRYLNDKLLRDMAGPLSAADMSALFKPAPFGETGHVSAFTQAAAPEHAALWELFRSVDMDKEGRVLQKWEAYVRELRGEAGGSSGGGGGSAGPDESPAAAALAAWSAVAPRARRALRHASPQHVEAVEGAILEFLDTTACTPPVGVVGLRGARGDGGALAVLLHSSHGAAVPRGCRRHWTCRTRSSSSSSRQQRALRRSWCCGRRMRLGGW